MPLDLSISVSHFVRIAFFYYRGFLVPLLPAPTEDAGDPPGGLACGGGLQGDRG